MQSKVLCRISKFSVRFQINNLSNNNKQHDIKNNKANVNHSKNKFINDNDSSNNNKRINNNNNNENKTNNNNIV